MQHGPPPDTERSIARRIIIFLEPRRVLYSAYDYESVHPCTTPIAETKNYLTSELQNIDDPSELNTYVRSMRNTCNKFLNKCSDKKEFRCYACQPGNIDNWIFTSAIGELRGVFDVMIRQIAKAYGTDNSGVIIGGTYIEQYNSVINRGLYVSCCWLSCIASLR